MHHHTPALQQEAKATTIMVPRGGALRGTSTTGTHRDKPRPWVTTRLQKELEGLWADLPEWCIIPGADATDLFRWRVVVVGPEGSPYDGGVFVVRVEFPREYPFKAPRIAFDTKVSTRDALNVRLVAAWSPLWSSESLRLVDACVHVLLCLCACDRRCTTRT